MFRVPTPTAPLRGGAPNGSPRKATVAKREEEICHARFFSYHLFSVVCTLQRRYLYEKDIFTPAMSLARGRGRGLLN